MPGHHGGMQVTVRAAALEDQADDLLYVSARRYYDAYAGGEAAARRMLRRVHPLPGHAASAALCRVAEADGEVVGVIAGFPADDGERLARRFLPLTAPGLGPRARARPRALAAPPAPPRRGRLRLPPPARGLLVRRRAGGRPRRAAARRG